MGNNLIFFVVGRSDGVVINMKYIKLTPQPGPQTDGSRSLAYPYYIMGFRNSGSLITIWIFGEFMVPFLLYDWIIIKSQKGQDNLGTSDFLSNVDWMMVSIFYLCNKIRSCLRSGRVSVLQYEGRTEKKLAGGQTPYRQECHLRLVSCDKKERLAMKNQVLTV